MTEKRNKIQHVTEDGTVAGCIGTGKPIPPNSCGTCPLHSDRTCQDAKSQKEQKQ